MNIALVKQQLHDFSWKAAISVLISGTIWYGYLCYIGTCLPPGHYATHRIYLLLYVYLGSNS
jgi:hypothetical protein